MAKNGGKESDAGDLNEKELVTADCEGNLCQPSHYFSILCSYLVFFSLLFKLHKDPRKRIRPASFFFLCNRLIYSVN